MKIYCTQFRFLVRMHAMMHARFPVLMHAMMHAHK
jgi:hypothetical protein